VWCRQLNEMRMKLTQLKQLEAAYTEMQILSPSEPGAALSRPITSQAAATAEASGVQSQSPPHSRSKESLGGSGSRVRDVAGGGIVDEAEDESSVPPSPAPPPRPRPPKNYRCVPNLDSYCFITTKHFYYDMALYKLSYCQYNIFSFLK